MTIKKYTLSKRLDLLIDRRISKEFRRRQSKDKWGDVTDHRLKRQLDPKEQAEYYDLDKRIKLQDLKNEVRNLYFESLMDFLKSQNITLMAQPYGVAFCNFKDVPVMLDAQPSISHGPYRSRTWLTFIAKNLTEPGVWICARVQPWIENKVDDISDFVIRRHSFAPMFEAAKIIREKTVEERTHVDAHGKGFIEWDMYGMIKYLGHAIGRELSGSEKYIRSNYKLEEYINDI